MPMSAQFQLGLELTNIVNPISQALSALGSLALVDAIKKAGSDVITEMKLASLIGRHKIDDVFGWHFRKVVGKADQTLISRYMDIILESGSGPTVQEALKNPALFSMVIQLSALMFAHEDVSLANAIVQAIERIVKETGERMEIVPDYVSLLGTLRTCQQQTAAFTWASTYESVERRILDAIRAPDLPLALRNAKRRKVENPMMASSACVTNRGLPFPVLQCLLMWVQTLQSFPEHRLIHLRCNTGISTAVVWCHYILGLTVTVSLQGSEVVFSGKPGSVLIVESSSQQTGATLMNPADQHEPLFTLLNDENHPHISFETRTGAYGYGLMALKQARLSEAEIRCASHWITAHTVSLTNHARTFKFLHIYPDAPKPANREWDQYWFEPGLPTKEQLLRAACFLFALNHLDMDIIESTIDPPKKGRFMDHIKWAALVTILVSFARIREEDLENCKNMPLSLHGYQKLQEAELVSDKDFRDYEPPDLIMSFELVSRLLLGHVYSEEYVKPSVLVSAWGWSLFFESVNAEDPTDVPVNTMRVVCGVPARHGLRKTRIIDGPTEVLISSATVETFCKDPRICYFPGVSTASKGITLVGHHSDAFQVVQTFEWMSRNKVLRTHKLGFREMQELCFQADRLHPCVHVERMLSFHEWIDKRTYYPYGGETSPGSAATWNGSEHCFQARWPKDDAVRDLSAERVLVGLKACKEVGDVPTEVSSVAMGSPISTDVWFFYVSTNPAARWLQLFDLVSSCEVGAFSLVMRGRDTCIECASRTVFSEKKKPVLVLL